MNSAVEPLFLNEEVEPVLSFFHAPQRQLPDVGAVLICPPFGWEEICSYRSRREWALDLASAGFAAMRIDLPSTGDSGGSPDDPGRGTAWTAAVVSAVEYLRERARPARVSAIGIGLGGLLACRAIAVGAAIDELVLWAVPARGRAFVRELSAFASLEETAGEGGIETVELADGGVAAGGFVLNAQTVEELEQLDVTALSLPAGRPRRALLLDRDGIGPDKRLRSHLESLGAEVTVAAGPGYGAMMAKPHDARAPRAVFGRVRAWLREGAHATDASDAGAESAGSGLGAHARPCSTELALEGTRIRERPMVVEQPFGTLFGIVAEPLASTQTELCAVLLNAGAIRRVGPNRMWVEAARRWAALGVPSLRLDVEGIGDADGDGERFGELAELYTRTLVSQVQAALDVLERRGLAHRFALTGLCAGAHWAFHAALQDERVAAAFMVNPRALFWDESLEAARDLRKGLRPSAWPTIVRGEVPLVRLVTLACKAPFTLTRRSLAQRSAQRRGENPLEEALDRLRDTGKLLRFIFSEEEPLYEELERDRYLEMLDRWPNVGITSIPGRVHTLRPLLSQQRAHEALDRALAETVERAAGPLVARSR